MRAAVCQMNSQGDYQENMRVALDLLDQSRNAGSDVAVLPEVFTYRGDRARGHEYVEAIPGPTTEALAAKARELKMWVLAGSIREASDDPVRSYNTSVLFDRDGNEVARYRKIHLFDVDIAGKVSAKESENIRPGNEIVLADIEGHKFGLTICYDLRFPELFRALALMDCEAIFLPAAFTMQTGRDHWEVLIRARAIENSCYMLASGLVGKHESGGETYGHSMIVDPWGTVVSCMPDETGIVVSELDFARQARIRQEIPVLANRQPSAYPELLINELAVV
jgi:predicted amidohydrolase